MEQNGEQNGEENRFVEEVSLFALLGITSAIGFMWKDVIMAGIEEAFGKKSFGWLLFITIVLTIIVILIIKNLPREMPTRYQDIVTKKK